MLESKEEMIAIDGAEIFCRTLGKGNPLFIIHGGPGLDQSYLQPQMDRLAEKYQVIYFDQRACGRSTGEVSSKWIHIDRYAKDLEQLRNKFEYEKIALLGHSWGGMFAMQYAIRYPENISSMVLLDTIPASSEGMSAFVQEFKRRTKDLPYTKPTDCNPDSYAKYLREIFRTYLNDGNNINQLTLKFTEKSVRNGFQVDSFIRGSFLNHHYDLYESLSQLQMPVKVIHGDSDPIPYQTAERIHQVIRGSQFILIKDCGHFPYIEQPEVLFSNLL